MINRKIAFSALSIVSALSLMTGATFAFFSNTATSSANTFSAGSLNLQIDDEDEAVTESVTASLVGTNMLPGGTPIAGFVSLHNGGTVNIAEVEMTTTVTETADPSDPSFLGDVLNVAVLSGDDDTCTTNQTSHTGTLASALGDGFSPLTLSEMHAQTFDAFPGLLTGADRFICFSVQMASAATSIYQGDAVSVDLAFTGNQDASQ